MLRRNGVGIGGMAERQNEICRFARLTGSVENRAVIIAQDLQPVREIIGVAHLRHDVQMRAEKRARRFPMSSSRAYACDPRQFLRSRARREGCAVQ